MLSKWGNAFKLVNKNKISVNQKKRVQINKTVKNRKNNEETAECLHFNSTKVRPTKNTEGICPGGVGFKEKKLCFQVALATGVPSYVKTL